VCSSLLRPCGKSNDSDGDDSVTISSKRPEKKEKLLKFYLGLLREDAGWCSRATNAILQCHVRFAFLMSGRIDSASKSWIKGLKCDESETTKLADDINRASLNLSLYVTRMKDNLNSFVSTLDNIEVSARKERQTLVGWVLGWLKSLFKTLARIFVSLGTFISVAPGTCGIAPVDSTLGKGAVAFCGAASGAFLEYTILYREEVIDS
jgi:hypothetical protein